MKKIKRFRIKIRPSYVERLLRRNGKISGVTKEDIDRHISESQRLLDPCTVYDTYKPDDVVRKGFAVTDKSVVGVSLIVVTIGERLA